VPLTEDGAAQVAAQLQHVDDPVGAPVSVWRWNDELGGECRGTLYGWRGTGPDRAGLVVSHRYRDACGLLRDVIEWIPARFIRARGE
jgi:hypothetical protein